MRLCVWRPLDERQGHIRLVIAGAECGRGTCRPIGKIAPAALIAEFAVETFPAIALFFRVQQRELSSLNNANIGAPGNFQQAQRTLSFFFHPLVSADRGDAQHIEFIRLQKNQNGLHVGRGWSARILIHNHFNLLGV